MKIGYAIIIRWINYLLIFLFYTSPKNQYFWIIFLLAWSTLLVVESLRLMGYYSRKKDLMFIAIALIAGVIVSFLSPIGMIYFFSLTWDIVFYFQEKKLKWLMAGLGLLFVIVGTVRKLTFHEIYTMEFWLNHVMSMSITLLVLITNFLIAYNSKKEVTKRRQVQKLNQQIEQLTIEKERNRMAQEIHDSLGHYLAGLIMHLEFLEKIVEEDPKKAKLLTNKMQNLARQGMQEVRLAVKTLRDQDCHDRFENVLRRLCDNLQIENDLTIDLKLDSPVNGLSPKLKSIIYRNIQEALTNSIKHGKSTIIHLQITDHDNEVFCQIQDNGKGCSDLVRGNGLKGIEARLQAVNGLISWNSELDKGFTLKFAVPWAGENR